MRLFVHRRLCSSFNANMVPKNTTTSLAEEDFYEFKDKGIPIMVYLIIVCIVGTIGNLHVLVVYFIRYKTGVYKTFVLCLAAVDFLGCSFCVPSTLYIVRHPAMVTSSAFCKTSRMAMYFVGAYSLILLDIIAVDRYRKVCRATRPQLTQRTARTVCVTTCVAVCVLVAFPVTILYGINRKPTQVQGLLGYECTVLDEFKNSTFTKIYRGLIFILFVLLSIVSAVLYSLIGRKIYAHQKKYQSHTEDATISRCCVTLSRKSNAEPVMESLDNIQGSKKCSTETCDNKEASEEKTEPKENSDRCLSDGMRPGIQGDRLECKRKKLNKSQSITMVFLVVSLISFGGYLPYLIATIVRNIDRELFENFAEDNAALDLFIRWMLFLNNAVNPIVYGFMDRKFRKELSNIYNQTRKKSIT